MTYRIPYECMCCGGCMERCPMGAIHPCNGYYEVDEDLCIDCGICLETCPYNYPYLVGEPDDPRDHRLRVYAIDPETCIGCTACSRICPVGAAVGEVKQPFTIDQELCIGCGLCTTKCRKGAISIVGDPLPELPYSIDPETCVSCDQCKKHCPAKAISGTLVPKFVVDMEGVYHVPFEIDAEACIRCGICTTWCPKDAIAPADAATIEARAAVVAAKRELMPMQPTEHAIGVL